MKLNSKDIVLQRAVYEFSMLLCGGIAKILAEPKRPTQTYKQDQCVCEDFGSIALPNTPATPPAPAAQMCACGNYSMCI